MPMKNKDSILKAREDVRQRMSQALKDSDHEAYVQAFDSLLENVCEEVCAEYDQQLEGLRQDFDASTLAARGVRQLTSAERNYYQKLAEAMGAANPRQALDNLDVVMPETIIDSVFDDLRTNHPLLSAINFIPSNGAVRMIMNTNGYQEAAWGKLCDDIVKELTSGFKEVDTNLLKLSAFLPVCKAMLDLGPVWLDRYVREVLYEALANGLEAGIINGDGNGKPIGMTRQVGDGVTVVSGVYPKKDAVVLDEITPTTIGNLVSILAVSPKGSSRPVRGVIFLVNPQDYFRRIMPATTLLAPDGTYRNDVMPYPMTIIQSPALEPGEAVIGLSSLYFAAAGASKTGQIDYSDHARYLEDERIYVIKTYANGMPMDNNAFLRLDISSLRGATYHVTTHDAPTPSVEAELSDLKIGSLSLTPAFDSATTTYTTATTNATNVITATPADARNEIKITVNDAVIANGTAATWQAGSNTVKVTVTAADGVTTKVYAVTVTKSGE